MSGKSLIQQKTAIYQFKFTSVWEITPFYYIRLFFIQRLIFEFIRRRVYQKVFISAAKDQYNSAAPSIIIIFLGDQKMFVMLVLFGLVFSFSQALCPTSIDFNANKKYSFVGKSTIDVSSNSTFKSTTDRTSSPFQVAITYPESLKSRSPQVTVIITSYTAGNLIDGVSVRLEVGSADSTSMQINIYTGKTSNIAKLIASYFLVVVDQSLSFNFMMVNYKTSFPSAGTEVSTANSPLFVEDFTLPTSFNSANGKVVQFLSGINAFPTTSNLVISFGLIVSLISDAQLKIQVSATQATATLIKQLAYTILLYNQNGLNSTQNNYFLLNSGVISATSTMIMETDFNDQNFYSGVISLTRQKTSSTIFMFDITTGANYLNFNQSVGITSVAYSYLAIFTQYCISSTPYLYSPYNLCFDICPTPTTSNAQTLSCEGTTTSTAAQLLCSEESSNIGLIAGCAAGGAILVTIIIVIIYKCKNPSEPKKEEQPNKVEKPETDKAISSDDIQENRSASDRPESIEQDIAQREPTVQIINDTVSPQKMGQSRNTAASPSAESHQALPLENSPGIEEVYEPRYVNPSLRIQSHNIDVYALQMDDNLSIAFSSELEGAIELEPRLFSF